MSNQSSTIVQRLWNYCNVQREDGVSYGDYVEQLTYLLFLKMADEQVRQLGKTSVVPDNRSERTPTWKEGNPTGSGGLSPTTS